MKRIKLRQSVRQFAQAMELKLRKNDHKGGWENCSDEYLIANIVSETAELLHDRADGLTESGDEAVDIANYAMMYFDNKLIHTRNK